MIGRLNGLLVEKQPPEILIEVSGVGYEVQMPMTCFYDLPNVGEQAVIYTHFVVREDAQSLYGFSSRLDRDLFRLLIKVNGVGPKLAAGILSGLDANQFIRCVEARDANALVKLPGVGKKTAERLLIEMTDRIGQLEGQFIPASPNATVTSDSANGGVVAGHDPREEAEAALIALGYKPQEASKAISKVAEESMSSQELIRLALRAMIPAS